MTSAPNARDVEPRFGDWGPGYLLKSPDAAFGVVKLRPGDAFDSHLHEHHDESFFLLEGSVELWLARECTVLVPGDLFRCPAGIEHYVRNVGTEDARALFIKAPWVDADKIDVPWTPPS